MKKILTSVAVIIAVVSTSLFLTSGKQGDQPKPNLHRCTYSTGAPDSVAGAPIGSFASCDQTGCHNHYPVKHRYNMITATSSDEGGFERGYHPGTTYTVTATVHSPGVSTFGFEISPEKRTRGLMGTLQNLSGGLTQFPSAGDVDFITHTLNGSSFGSGTGSWQFVWTAPAIGSDTVIWYVAVNVAPSSDAGGPTGDTIVLCTQPLRENDTSYAGISEITSPVLQAEIYPTVSNGQFTVSVDNAQLMINNEQMQMEVYNMTGEKIYQSTITTSKSQISLNEPSGCYIVRLNTENASTYRKIIITH